MHAHALALHLALTSAKGGKNESVTLERGFCRLGVTDVCETELACGDMEGWRFGVDVGGQKGVVAFGICRTGAGDGDRDKGSGFRLEKDSTTSVYDVCSDWVCRAGQLEISVVVVWTLIDYPGPGASLQIWIFHITVADHANQHGTSSRYSSAHILHRSALSLSVSPFRRLTFIHALSPKISHPLTLILGLEFSVTCSRSHTYRPSPSNRLPTQQSASAIPSGPRGALTSPTTPD